MEVASVWMEESPVAFTTRHSRRKHKGMPQRVLVTGGAGYIGSHTVVELLTGGYEVFVIDNFCNSRQIVLDRVSAIAGQAVPRHELDIRDKLALRRVFKEFRPDAVIHFAGLKAVGESVKAPLDYYDVNLNGTVCLLQAMETAGCGRIVFSSSATVYGEPRYLPIDEKHPCAPTSPYGRTKWMAEKILTDWHRSQPAASVVVLRYFNPVGAHASGRIGEDPLGVPNNLVPFIARVATGRQEKLSVFGDDYETADGTGVRDYIHVVNLARAHVCALGHATAQKSVEEFNIGTGRGYSVLDIVNAFARASGREIPYRIVPRRDGDIARCLADPSRANAVLGWRPKQGLDEMCASVWSWQSQNPEGYAA